jgi:putative glutamine amidotransferase
MRRVAVTQRVELVAAYAERRDALDQRWASFLGRCGLIPLLVPNNAEILAGLLEGAGISGVVLTGGGNLMPYGGNAPERDRTEALLIQLSIQQDLPLLGVCRGMQAIQTHFGVPLTMIEGHVTAHQTIAINGKQADVNSYHDLGTLGTTPELEVWATADDGVVKAVRHRRHRIEGIMWHPERFAPDFRVADVNHFRRFFGAR